MRHARPDYDRIQDPEGRIPADEPVFLLRAQDKAAPSAVMHWIEQARVFGASHEIRQAAYEQYQEMLSWQRTHGCKTPDMPADATPAPAPTAKPCGACGGTGLVDDGSAMVRCYHCSPPAAPAPTAPEGKRPTTNRALYALDCIIDSWRQSSVDGPNDDAWTRAHNETLRNCCDELSALSVAEHARETEAMERLAVHLRLHEAMHPEAPTAPAQPAPDEGAMESLARLLYETMRDQCEWEWDDPRYNRPGDEAHEYWRKAARTALAAVGGEVAALRGAILHADETDTIWGPESEPVVKAALDLTPSSAAAAVADMVEAAAEVDAARSEQTWDEHVWADRLHAAYERLRDAAKPFLAARGGGR